MASPNVFPRSHVGFDSITTQIERKLLKRGFQFNVICVGMEKPKMRTLWHRILSCANRSNWVGKVDTDQYDLRRAFDRF